MYVHTCACVCTCVYVYGIHEYVYIQSRASVHVWMCMSVLCASCVLINVGLVHTFLLVLPRPEPHDSLINTSSVPALVQSVELAQDSLKDSGSFELITVTEDSEQVEEDYQEDIDGKGSTKAVEEEEVAEEEDMEEEEEQESQIDDVVITV